MPIITGQKNPSTVSFAPRKLDILLYRGDSLDILFKLKDKTGVGVNLAGFTAAVQFKDSQNNVVATPTVTLNYNSENGLVRIFINDTSEISPGAYSYGFKLTDPSDRKRTYFAGTLTVEATP